MLLKPDKGRKDESVVTLSRLLWCGHEGSVYGSSPARTAASLPADLLIQREASDRRIHHPDECPRLLPGHAEYCADIAAVADISGAGTDGQSGAPATGTVPDGGDKTQRDISLRAVTAGKSGHFRYKKRVHPLQLNLFNYWAVEPVYKISIIIDRSHLTAPSFIIEISNSLANINVT